ncbi:MAG: biotin--[acetyl-CoA-carboxylase] ligase [Planctomycetota bacterium]|nr:biotin--[acetyl-CoA-carboxylase] ligase [Planctomycetota bacterium]
MANAQPVRIVRHGVVDSTSERAFAELAAGRARHGDVHVAAAQTKGRGRLGRNWHSPAGEGLFASFVLRPERAWNPAALTIALGLATLDAVRALGLDGASLKWPNDVVVRGAKLAGVLAETRDLDPRNPAYVAGIGINVRQRAFPPELCAERPVTSLALCGIEATVEDALRELVEALPRRCAEIEEDVGRLEADFLRAAGLERGHVRVEVASGTITGVLARFSVAHGIAVRREAEPEARFALEHVRGLVAV